MTSRASLLILCGELENDFSYIQEASALCARAELRLAWHRDLLDRMALDGPGVRSALLPSRDLVDRIDELRRFRHLFRNLYKTRLHPGKLKIVNDSVHGLADEFLPPHHSFIA